VLVESDHSPVVAFDKVTIGSKRRQEGISFNRLLMSLPITCEEREMADTGRDHDGDNKARIDGDKLKESVDELLQRDQLDNDKSHAGDKPGFSNQPAPDSDKAAETMKNFHD
jgi:hypothetical protein